MKRTYMLTKYKTPQLSKVIDCITEAINPEKIFLLGATADHKLSENIFRGSVQPVYEVKEYQLLILLPADNRREIDEIQDIVESTCRVHTAVTAIIVHMPVFNKWLFKGHLLAYVVYTNNCMVYDAGKIPLVEPGIYDLQDLRSKVAKEYKEWLGRAMEFMVGVEVYRKRKQYGMAIFLLHQAAELALMAAVRLATGFRAGTHNLDKLARYAVPFCGEAFNVFPRNNDKERQLFKLLQKSYIHGRYKDDFVVKESDFLLLLERVRKLVEVVQQTGTEKLSKTTAI